MFVEGAGYLNVEEVAYAEEPACFDGDKTGWYLQLTGPEIFCTGTDAYEIVGKLASDN